MESRSQFVGRYKKDLSIDHLRAKVARRKSIRQKENRDVEFRKSRGLALMDSNVSFGIEPDLPVLDEVNETKASMDNSAVFGKRRDNIDSGRQVLLKRYLEEKEIRKLKEQRQKANKAVFKCGLYKPENPFIPVLHPTSQHAFKVKTKEKPAPPAVTRVNRPAAKIDAPVPSTRSRPVQTVVPAVTRVTRSAVKIEAPVHKPLSRPAWVPVENKISDHTASKGRGQKSAPKNEKENKVTTIPSVRTTRATAAIAAKSRLPTVKAINTSVVKPPKTTKVNSEQESVLKEPEPAVLNQEKSEKLKLEVVVKEQPKPAISMKVTAVESEILTKTTIPEESKPSFAPENFEFQPLAGLSTFKFQPLTPKRANAFLAPTATWSPLAGKSNFVYTRLHENEENRSPQVSPPDLAIKTTSVEQEMDTLPEAKGDVCTALPVMEESLPPCAQDASTPTSPQSDQTHHDVPYFRGLLKSEIQRLALLCSEWDTRFEEDIPEDSKDLIRTTVGQTRLLITERFKQFEGLVDNCEFKRGEKETTCTDLDGFWDMIYFQIEDVTKKFGNLKKLEANSWQQITVQAKKVVRKKAPLAPTVNKSQGENARAAARSRLAAIKAAMRNQVKQEDMADKALVSEQPTQVDPVVFDAGFFRIESPAKLPGCRKTITFSQTSDTPKSTKKLQNSDEPLRDGTEEAADHIDVQKSPSSEKSPVRKVLFDTEEESLQHHQEDPVVTISAYTESEIPSQEVDLTKYLACTTEVTQSLTADSPGLMELSRLETELEEDSTFKVPSTDLGDVLMCSPEKVEESRILAPEDGIIEMPDEDIKKSDSPLDFLESCTSDMVTRTPLKSESMTAVSDLIVFSPMES
ncbi:disks large-associated protein 5 isoform X2 [Rana temporaria]|uniref:disks large-associated protein 5 isoform X2 n=1 Tax=Rana temporaria TaxID=8407 RepID=UPI001AAD4A57|nr:disks large-associated protein 5 isoform X2 [Rana temporaria]